MMIADLIFELFKLRDFGKLGDISKLIMLLFFKVPYLDDESGEKFDIT